MFNSSTSCSSCLQIFSLVVFASIVNEGYVNVGSERLHCVFNRNGDACNYGVFVGLVGLLASSFFFLLDYKFSSISSVKDRKKAVMLEIGFSGEKKSNQTLQFTTSHVGDRTHVWKKDQSHAEHWQLYFGWKTNTAHYLEFIVLCVVLWVTNPNHRRRKPVRVSKIFETMAAIHLHIHVFRWPSQSPD